MTKIGAFPGHNLPIGCLGVFILWLGWYGFNGAAATTIDELASVFVTTTIAPSVATLVAMIVTWVKYGKPDVSMCLNASLAGLVAVTAPCDNVCDAFGAIVIGQSGVLVIFGVWLLDNKLHIDDPVGAVAVHCVNGIWGTISVGLFATSSAPAFCKGYRRRCELAPTRSPVKAFNGGGKQLGIQLGMGSTALWTAVTIAITFFIIKKTLGLRVSREEKWKDSTSRSTDCRALMQALQCCLSTETRATRHRQSRSPEMFRSLRRSRSRKCQGRSRCSGLTARTSYKGRNSAKGSET